MDVPQIDVVRGLPGLELRVNGDSGPMPTLFGHFSRFNQWYEISSWFEGDFLERFAPGAFEETFRMHWSDGDPHRVKVQFQHGFDFAVGERLLGKLSELREDDIGGYYEAPLFDTQYNRELVPGLEAGEYGASFRFRVTKEEWNEDPGVSEGNPKGLPERTITAARVFELGPVAFGASPAATAGLRCLTDDYYNAVRERAPKLYEDACRAAGRDIPVNGDSPPTRPRNTGTGRRAKRTELKALPDAALKRRPDLESITTFRRGQEIIEARSFTPDLKVTHGDDQITVEGYVAVYDEPRNVGGDDGWTEIWAPKAATRSVSRDPDVRLTLNGEGEPLARSKAGNLELISDDYGLHVKASIDPASQRGEDIALALQRGDHVDVQVGFDVVKQRWTDDHTQRFVEEIYLHDIALRTEQDPSAGDALSELHASRDLVDTEPDGEHMSLALAVAIRNRHNV